MHMASYGRALSALHPVIATTFDSLAYGLEKTQKYHTDEELQRTEDPHLYLHLARRHACKKLVKAGIHARLIYDEGNFRMSSILVFHNGVAVWVLHTQEDDKGKIEPPVPGRSEPRQKFWR